MASDDKKTKADPAPKTEAPPKSKSTADAKSTSDAKSTPDAKSTSDAKSSADVKSTADAAPGKAEGGEKEAGSSVRLSSRRGPEAGVPSLSGQLEPDLRGEKEAMTRRAASSWQTIRPGTRCRQRTGRIIR